MPKATILEQPDHNEVFDPVTFKMVDLLYQLKLEANFLLIQYFNNILPHGSCGYSYQEVYRPRYILFLTPKNYIIIFNRNSISLSEQ